MVVSFTFGSTGARPVLLKKPDCRTVTKRKRISSGQLKKRVGAVDFDLVIIVFIVVSRVAQYQLMI